MSYYKDLLEEAYKERGFRIDEAIRDIHIAVKELRELDMSQEEIEKVLDSGKK